MNPIAYNVPISELINALTDIMLKGNKYVDVLVDEDNVLRLRGMKSISESRKKKKKRDENTIPPLPNDINLMDLI